MALYLKKELDDDARIYVWEITETEEELMANTAVPDNELEELSYTKSEARRKKNLQLAIYWCAKEAIYKRMSLSGVDFAEQIEVERFNPRDEGEIYATFTHKDGTELEFELSYEVIENHVMVWVVG